MRYDFAKDIIADNNDIFDLDFFDELTAFFCRKNIDLLKNTSFDSRTLQILYITFANKYKIFNYTDFNSKVVNLLKDEKIKNTLYLFNAFFGESNDTIAINLDGYFPQDEKNINLKILKLYLNIADIKVLQEEHFLRTKAIIEALPDNSIKFTSLIMLSYICFRFQGSLNESFKDSKINALGNMMMKIPSQKELNIFAELKIKEDLRKAAEFTICQNSDSLLNAKELSRIPEHKVKKKDLLEYMKDFLPAFISSGWTLPCTLKRAINKYIQSYNNFIEINNAVNELFNSLTAMPINNPDNFRFLLELKEDRIISSISFQWSKDSIYILDNIGILNIMKEYSLSYGYFLKMMKLFRDEYTINKIKQCCKAINYNFDNLSPDKITFKDYDEGMQYIKNSSKELLQKKYFSILNLAKKDNTISDKSAEFILSYVDKIGINNLDSSWVEFIKNIGNSHRADISSLKENVMFVYESYKFTKSIYEKAEKDDNTDILKFLSNSRLLSEYEKNEIKERFMTDEEKLNLKKQKIIDDIKKHPYISSSIFDDIKENNLIKDTELKNILISKVTSKDNSYFDLSEFLVFSVKYDYLSKDEIYDILKKKGGKEDE